MRRKYNTKKFIKDVLNDRYEHQQAAIQSVAEVLQRPSFGIGNEMAGSNYTPACCLSKLRSSLEAGKKQLRVWLQYVCSMAEILLYSSLGAPLVLFWSPYRDSEFSRKCHGALTEMSWSSDGVLLEVYASSNVCSSTHEACFKCSRTV